MCDGIKAGIDSAVHEDQYIWDENSTTEYWGFFLVDANNALNKINQINMLWKVCHLWPSSDFFFFNCYLQWSSLVLWNGNWTASFLHSREGVIQGDPQTMIAYGIGILPLIKSLKREIPNATQTWYDDDTGALGMSVQIETDFNLITRQGPGRGYHPELSKRVLIVNPDNLEAEKEFGARHGFKVCMGARYLGGYIGGENSKSD